MVVKREIGHNWVGRRRRWVVPSRRWVVVNAATTAAGGRRRRGRRVDILRGWRRRVIVSTTTAGAWRRRRRRAVGGGWSCWRRRRGWRRGGNLATWGALDVIPGRRFEVVIFQCYCKSIEREEEHHETTPHSGSHFLRIRGMRLLLLKKEEWESEKETM